MASPLDAASQSERNVQDVIQEVKLNISRELFKILTIGSSGSGKSTLINSMFGKDVAKVWHGEKHLVSEEHVFKGEYDGVKIAVHDTVGFGDTGSKNDRRILLDIAKHGHFDLILICSKLQDKADRAMFTGLASHLHEEMWKKTVVVLTFANHFIQLESIMPNAQEAAIEEKINQYQDCIVDFLSDHVKEEVLRDIPVCIAGRKDEKKLPTTEDWLNTLWKTCIDRFSDETHPLLKKFDSHYSRTIKILAFTGAIFGAGFGAKFGSVVPIYGTAIGATAGATVGAIAGAVVGSFVKNNKDHN